MSKITVVVPTSSTKPQTNTSKEEITIPFLGRSTRYIMIEDEFRQWLDMWLADNSLGPIFYVERHGR